MALSKRKGGMARAVCCALAFLFHALIFAEPELIRREPAGAVVISEISAHSGSVSAVFDGGAVKSFGSEGKAFWEFKAGGRLLPFITRSRDAAAYICRANGDFFALNRAGTQQWQMHLGEPITAPAVCGWDDRLFLFMGNKALCVTATGQQLWKQTFNAPFASDAQLSVQGGFIVMLSNNTLLNVSPFGAVTEIKLSSMPAFMVPVTSRTSGAQILVIYTEGRLELYDGKGEAYSGLTHLNAAPLAAVSQGNMVLVQLASGQLVMLDIDNGRIVWRAAFQSGVGTAGNRAQKPRIQFDQTRETVYVLSISGAAGFSRRDGKELWNLKLENAAVTPAFDEGILYSSGRDWIMYLYRTEQRPNLVRRTSLSLMGRYGLGNPPIGREWQEIRSAYAQDFTVALNSIARSIETGSLGEDEGAAAGFLLGIANDLKALQTERIEAIRLLGLIGSRETIPFLVRKLREEREVSVQTELALSLGRIGSDPQGSVFDSFERIIRRNLPAEEEPLLNGIAAAIGNICRFTGPEVSARGIKLLVALSDTAFAPAVRHRAQQELHLLLQ